MKTELFIGVMSGTSMDAIDAVLTEISVNEFRTLGHVSQAISPELRQQLQALCFAGQNELDRCAKLDVELGRLIAQTVNNLLHQKQLSAQDIRALGSHGQTIRHSPDSEPAFSWQIGNPSIIAEYTGIPTVADFRMADIAAGGQGAPLVPAFHHAVFSLKGELRALINIGGIANITLLNSLDANSVSGFDIGPGNTLMDQWIQKWKGCSFDHNGEWARSGRIIPTLLTNLLSDPFISRTPPKSSGKEYFNLTWLDYYLNREPIAKPEDVQRTLNEFTAVTIANSIKEAFNSTPTEAFLCGGGVKNGLLLERLNELLPSYSIALTDVLGIGTQLVEASAFAWLACQTINQRAGNITAVTGARKNKILGGIYYP